MNVPEKVIRVHIAEAYRKCNSKEDAHVHCYNHICKLRSRGLISVETSHNLHKINNLNLEFGGR